MPNSKLRSANFFDSFCNVSNLEANSLRARKARAATAAQVLMFAVVIGTLIPFQVFSVALAIAFLGVSILLRGAAALAYQNRSVRNERAWAGILSGSTLLCSLAWSTLVQVIWLQKGLYTGNSLMMLLLAFGFTGTGAIGFLPDRVVARAHVLIFMVPIAIGFGFEHQYLLIVVATAYGAFVMQMIRAQSSILKELGHRQEKYEALANAAQEIVIIHLDGIIMEVNPAFEKEFGFSANEIIGRHCLHLATSVEYDRAMQILRRGELGNRTVQFQRKDGSLFQGEVFSRFFTYRAQKCKLVCVQNITQRLMAEELAAESVRKMEAVSNERSREALESTCMKSEFIANMSHEIRTPLNAIIGITELLADTYPTDVQKRYLRTMSESSEHLLTLINDVLDFSKIDAGKLQLEDLQFSISSLIESQADLLSSRAQQKGINIVSAIDADLPATVRGDAGRISQVLLNLIGNAIKFTNRGHIEVRALADAPVNGAAKVRFEVVDTGEGLGPGVAERLFRPFVQADSSTSRKHGGTGLGLSICKRLVEAMGGEIGVESTRNAGSKFWFTLPLEVIDSETIRTKFSRGDWSSRQVFVMTDENSSARTVGQYLQSWGLTATMGSSSWITNDKSDRRLYDAVIVAASFRRSTSFHFDGPVIEIQNEGGPYMELDGAFASLTNPVRQSDLYNAVLNAVSLANSTVRNEIPQRQTEFSERRAAEPNLAPKNSSGLLRIDARVLVAEDNSTNQMLALAHLRKLGISAQPVANGVEALDALARGTYDLVLMDCQMPEMDGFDATRRIREMETRTGAHIPIVALTANAFEEDRQRCLAVGMDAYLAKPLRREQLVMVLKRFLVDAA